MPGTGLHDTNEAGKQGLGLSADYGGGSSCLASEPRAQPGLKSNRQILEDRAENNLSALHNSEDCSDSDVDSMYREMERRKAMSRLEGSATALQIRGPASRTTLREMGMSISSSAEPNDQQERIKRLKEERKRMRQAMEAEERKEQQTSTIVRPRTAQSATTNPLQPASPSKQQRERYQTSKELASPSPKPCTSPTQKGTFYAKDAPVSAVNAGEREVTVCNGSTKITLHVTPSTKVQELLASAMVLIPHNVDPKTLMLAESYDKVGLERPLRRYEHVRDVMNSWDHDASNVLNIAPLPRDATALLLDAKSAPDIQPEDRTVFLYHSQKPGKWDKRFITLRADGQVLLGKKMGDETTNVCHLSDFDIYTPTARQMSKRIKPPKKYCYAIKSQQKSSMFLDNTNFVHFFCTNDKDVGREFYKIMQSWRSWYLVHVLGENQRKQQSLSSANPNQHYGLLTEQGHRIVRNHHQGNPTASNTKELYNRKMSARERSAPPASFPKAMMTSPPAQFGHEDGASDTGSNSATFAPSGLLGRTYSQRQRETREKEQENGAHTHPAQHQTPRLNEPRSSTDQRQALPVTANPQPTTTLPQRTRSLREKPKPLLDLTPEQQVAPQYDTKGKGHGVHVQPGHQLIDFATAQPTEPGVIVVPSSTTWRRPSASAVSHGNGSGIASGNAGVARSGTVKSTTGKARANGPLVDLREPSQFVQGSLLRDMEKKS